MKNRKGITILAALLISVSLTFGQTDPDRPVKMSYSLSTQLVDTIAPDTVTSSSQLYHTLYSQFPIWYELGNLGMPGLPAHWTGISRMNEPTYLQGLKPYAERSDQLLFYKSHSPYAILKYTSGGSQDINGQLINATFSRPIAPGLSVTAFLDFISSDGHYKNQRSSHSDFAVNIDFEKDRYQLKAGVETLSFGYGENGGLADPIKLPWNSTSPGNRLVNLNSGASDTKWTIIKGRQEFDVFRPRNKIQNIPPDSLALQDSVLNDSSIFIEDPFLVIDSLAVADSSEIADISERRYPLLFHGFDFQRSKRLYKDAQTPSMDFYKNYYLSEDGAEDSASFNHYTNQVGLSYGFTLWDSLPVDFQAGISHELSVWQSNQYSGQYQQLSGFGQLRGNYQSWSAIVNGEFRLLGPGMGAYELFVKMNYIPSGKRLHFQADFGSVLDLPGLFYQVFSGNHDRWMQRMRMQGEQFARLSLHDSNWNMDAGAGVHLISNWAYYDSTATARQTEYSSLLFTAFAKKQFSAGPFRSDNKLFLQYTNAREIPLPFLVASTSNFMHHDIHFAKTNGKLEIEYGIDVRYSTSFRGYAYQPSSGAFYLQNEQVMGNYPYVDLFLTLRVKRTRVFVKWEHVNGGLTGNNFFPVVDYPVKVRFLKYGVYWHFYD